MCNEIFFSEIDFLKGNEIWMHEKLPPFLNWQHHKLHHSWLVVHHKLHHSWLRVHQKLHHLCYTYQDFSHHFGKKIILSVLMKYLKFNAKILHLFTFIGKYILFNNCQLNFNNDIPQQWSHLKWNYYINILIYSRYV